MERTTSAPAALSPVATTAQDRRFFQAGGPDGSVKAATATGRWVAAITAVCSAGRSAAKVSRNAAGLIANSAAGSAPLPRRILELHESRVEDAVRRAVLDVDQ